MSTNIRVGEFEFDNYRYDEDGDVLYHSVGAPRVPAETDATSEARGRLRCRRQRDRDGHVNRRYLLARDGEPIVTWPEVHVPADEFSAVLATAA